MKFLMAFLLLITVLLLSPYDYICYKCTSIKIFYGEANSTWNSRKIDNCEHDWYVKSKFLGLLDMKKPDTPMLKINRFEVINYLGIEQRRQILKSLSDKNNKLKWGVLLIIKCVIYDFEFTESSFENFKSNKLDTFNWESWYVENQLFFQSEYNLQKAKTKVKMILKILGKIPDEHFTLFKKKLLVDVEEQHGKL